MLNKDIISEYLKNRDALNADFNRTSLFAPAAGVGNQAWGSYDDPGFPGSSAGGFVPRPYIPPTARSNPFVQGMLQSPSIAGLLDPGSFTGEPDGAGGWGWDSTLADGYVPPTVAQYGKTMFDLAQKASPTMMGIKGLAGLLGLGGDAGPGAAGSMSAGGTGGWGAPVTGNGYSGTTYDLGLDDPGDVSADYGGWGADIGLPGYSGSTTDFGLD